MPDVTGALLVSWLPATVAAVAGQTLYALRYPNPGRWVCFRIITVVGLWVGAYLLLKVDP